MTGETIVSLFRERVRRSPHRVASWSPGPDGRWRGRTWSEGQVAVEEIGLGLLELGLRPGDPVAILSATRREWTWCDLAAQGVGLVTVGIYPTLPPARVEELLRLSGARALFVDEASRAEALADRSVPAVGFDRPPAGGLDLDGLRARGRARRADRPDEARRRAEEIRPGTVASWVFTSGTTGRPKMARLTHANFVYVTRATAGLVDYRGERALAFLPLAHAFQRYASYLGLVEDVEAFYARSLDTVREDLHTVRPSVLTLVPRVLEKIHREVLARGRSGDPRRVRAFEKMLGALEERRAARARGRSAGLLTELGAKAAERALGRRVKSALGGQVKLIGSGGAPLSEAVGAFFEGIGIPVLEGWGLTETSAPACINTLDARRLGTVGRPLPGTEVRVAEDGELRVRGPGVFAGYERDDPATRAAFDDEGWLRTGDLGAIDAHGFVRVTGRKKELLVTAGGENVAPAPLEAALARHPWLEEAWVVGDRRPYVAALVAFAPEAREELLDAHGLSAGASDAELLAHRPVRAELERYLAEVNQGCASYASVQRLGAFEVPPSVEAGTLTPTLKLVRRVLLESNEAALERLYRGEASGPSTRA